MELDKGKVEFIFKKLIPKTVEDIRLFLGQASFYRSFIKDSTVARTLSHFLAQDV